MLGSYQVTDTDMEFGQAKNGSPDQQAQEFLESLWGNKGEGFILIWCLRGKVSHWFKEVEAAGEFVRQHQGEDLYVGCCLSPAEIGRYRRCPASRVAATCGLWADVDIASEVHRKQGLPPDRETALVILKKVPFKPTLLVDSGHGLQAWWLLKEPWTFESTEERGRFAELSRDWQRYLGGLFHSHGFALDSTGDLARILRIPGTLNSKGSAPAPVRLVSAGGPRYTDWTDFEGIVPGAGSGAFTKASAVSDSECAKRQVRLVFAPDRVPPMEQFMKLLEDQKAALTWSRKRRDFRDQSASAYCLSLACAAKRAGWSDQEAVDLLIAWRRKEGEDLKLDRLEWYVRYNVMAAEASVRAQERAGGGRG